MLLNLTAQLCDEAQQSANPTLPRQLKEKVQYLRVRGSTSPGRERELGPIRRNAKLLEALERDRR